MDKTVGNQQNSPKDPDQYYNEQIMEQEKRSHELAAIPVGGALIKKFAFLNTDHRCPHLRSNAGLAQLEV
jgi:hypothetical protein